MKRKIILILLAFIFVSSGWVFGEWLRKKNADPDGLKEDGASVASNTSKENALALAPMPADFVISQKKTIAQSIDGWNAEKTLDEILGEKDSAISAALLERYAKDIPLEDFPELIKLLIDNQEKLFENMTAPESLSTNVINSVLKVWFERDFDAAKDYVVNRITDKDSARKGGLATFMMGTGLISNWVNKDKEECITFVKEQAQKGDKEMWSALFMLTSSRQYPEDTFALFQDLESGSGQVEKQFQGIMYGMLFGNWYDKDSGGALAKLSEMKDESVRRSALTGILEKMTSQSPNDAYALIKNEWPAADQAEPLGILMQSYAVDSPLDALEFIRQSDLSDGNRKAALNGLISVVNAEKLQEILQNDSLLLSEEEKKELILEKLTGVSNIKSVTMAVYANGMNNNSPEEIAAMRSLFTQLPDADRAQALKDVVEKRRMFQREEMLLDVLGSLDPETRASMKNEPMMLIESMAGSNPKLAADYFTKELNAEGRDDEKTMSLLTNITRSYLKNDPTEAVAWANSLPEGNIRNQANLLCAVNDLKKNPQAAVSALENYQDKEAAKKIFSDTVDSIAGKDPQLLAKVLLEVKDPELSEEGVSSGFWKIKNISEGEMLAFIDDLAPKPDLQDEFRERYIDSVKGKNPELALELALEMKPSDDNKKRMQDLLAQFKKKDAARAKEWCEANGIAYEE